MTTEEHKDESGRQEFIRETASLINAETYIDPSSSQYEYLKKFMGHCPIISTSIPCCYSRPSEESSNKIEKENMPQERPRIEISQYPELFGWKASLASSLAAVILGTFVGCMGSGVRGCYNAYQEEQKLYTRINNISSPIRQAIDLNHNGRFEESEVRNWLKYFGDKAKNATFKRDCEIIGANGENVVEEYPCEKYQSQELFTGLPRIRFQYGRKPSIDDWESSLNIYNISKRRQKRENE